MHCSGFYFHVPAGVNGQVPAPEPSTPERAGLPPRRRRAGDSPKSRTARRQRHPPQLSGLTPTSDLAAATAQPTRFPVTDSTTTGVDPSWPQFTGEPAISALSGRCPQIYVGHSLQDRGLNTRWFQKYISWLARSTA